MRNLILLLSIWAGLLAPTAHATLNEVDKSSLLARNTLDNPGFELGKTKWTASGGSVALVTSGANLLFGANSLTWDSGSASQTLTSTAKAIDKGSYGKNGMAYCAIQTPSGTATHKLQVYDGSAVVAEKTITSNTTPINDVLNFPIPSSGNLSLRLISVASDEPLIAIDGCFLGEAMNVSSNAQSSLVASGYFNTTASCGGWARSSATPGAFTADTDCPGPTAEINPGPGTLQTTDVNLPKFTVNNLPPGNYKITWLFGFNHGASTNDIFATNDGTTTAGYGGNHLVAGTVAVISTFSYTSTANRTFELYASDSAATAITIDISDGNRKVYFTIERYPSTAELAYTPDTIAMSWSGHHADTCSWARTSATVGDPTADATCTLVEDTNQNFGSVATYTVTNAEPGIVFTPKRAGKYLVTAKIPYLISADGGPTFILTDGTNTIGSCTDFLRTNEYSNCSIQGYVTATSTASITLKVQSASTAGTLTIAENASNANTGSSLDWTIVQIDQSLPAPNILNTVVSPSSGGVRICSAVITNGGTPAVSHSDGNCVSSLTDNGTGDTTVNFTASTFSSAPSCTCSGVGTSVSGALCLVSSATAPTASLVRVVTAVSSSGAASDKDLHLICVGAK